LPVGIRQEAELEFRELREFRELEPSMRSLVSVIPAKLVLMKMGSENPESFEGRKQYQW